MTKKIILESLEAMFNIEISNFIKKEGDNISVFLKDGTRVLVAVNE